MQASKLSTMRGCSGRVANFRSFTTIVPRTPRFVARAQQQQDDHCEEPRTVVKSFQPSLDAALLTSMSLLMMAQPALADTLAPNNPFQSSAANSLYVTLALFVMSVPGIWSQVKRAPKASKKRKTYEVTGPKQPGAMSLKERAIQIVSYFKKYNYEVKEMGEVIVFAGLYKANNGQAAAITFYTFVSMTSVALVLSLLVPQVGNWWYLLNAFAPAAWFYYQQKGERVEEVRVKMATSDDEMTTDIIVEADIEEIERFRKELGLVEKGMIPVKGLLEV